MMKGTDFMLLMRAERHLKRQFVLNADEMRVWKRYGSICQAKLCGYNGCTNELGPRVDGEHHTIGNTPVCDDCYYDAFGAEIERFPIISPRLRRRVA
jgi:hypothetical protein